MANAWAWITHTHKSVPQNFVPNWIWLIHKIKLDWVRLDYILYYHALINVIYNWMKNTIYFQIILNN